MNNVIMCAYKHWLENGCTPFSMGDVRVELYQSLHYLTINTKDFKETIDLENIPGNYYYNKVRR